jgi:adenylyltransferase/sulfurtransferase
VETDGARSPRALVAGSGGLGCPAAWALAERPFDVTLVDPDVVDVSNLPRQVLFTPEDVGRPKASAAAARLRACGNASVRGFHRRLDDRSADELLDGVDVLVDATDGALAKDWINHLAVVRGVPLVHAAALGAEARVLGVPAGGRPCLACLFGRLEDEGRSCAEFGVWPAVVATAGFLAAETAAGLTRDPRARGGGYRLLDMEGGRETTLHVAPDPRCPVCGERRGAEVEAYRDGGECSVRAPVTASVAGALDLTEERCPMNLLRARRAVEGLPEGGEIEIALGEEGAETVPSGLAGLGHAVLDSRPHGRGLRVRVRRGAGRAARLDERALARFARQVVLPEVGEAGQARWSSSAVRLSGRGAALRVAAVYLATAGVGRLAIDASAEPGAGFPLRAGASSVEALAEGCSQRATGTVEVVGADDGAPVDVAVGVGEPARARAAALTLSLLPSAGGGTVVDEARADGGGEDDAHCSFAAGALLADAVLRRLLRRRAPFLARLGHP